jgi:putative transposase
VTHPKHTMRVMQLVVPIKLCPTRADEHALHETLERGNDAANHVSQVAFARRIWRTYDLQKVTYGYLRNECGLGSQFAVHVVKKVALAYNSGKREHRRGAHLRRFRWSSAIAFDQRNLSVDAGARTVSIWTVNGRRQIPFACSPAQHVLLEKSSKLAESDLCFRRGAYYLDLVVEIEEAPMNTEPNGFLGVDVGIVNLAVTSDGEVLPRPIYQPPKKGREATARRQGSGAHVNAVRYSNMKLRRRLQEKGTRSARRLLKKRSGTEARFAADVNHRISKTIVAEAERTGRGAALEDLEGIRDRARSRKPQRAALHSWSFHQLGSFIAYKARLAGVPVVFVDPAYTSLGCSSCGHVAKENRPTRDAFACCRCGLSLPADLNAAINIAARGAGDWAVSHAAARQTDPSSAAEPRSPWDCVRTADLLADRSPSSPEATVTGKLALAGRTGPGKLGPSGPRS